jgi:hypothetical protein
MLQKLLTFAAWAGLCVIAYSTLSPLRDRPILLTSSTPEHLAAFSILGTLFCLAYPRRTPAVLLIVLGSAALLELLQFLTPDRHARTLDALQKMAGGAAGVFAGRVILRFDRARFLGAASDAYPRRSYLASRSCREGRPQMLDVLADDGRVAEPSCAAVIAKLSWRPVNCHGSSSHQAQFASCRPRATTPTDGGGHCTASDSRLRKSQRHSASGRAVIVPCANAVLFLLIAPPRMTAKSSAIIRRMVMRPPRAQHYAGRF